MAALNRSRSWVVNLNMSGNFNPRNLHAKPRDARGCDAHVLAPNPGYLNDDWCEVVGGEAEIAVADVAIRKGKTVIGKPDAGQLGLHLRFDPG